jgi:hypothetical protein
MEIAFHTNCIENTTIYYELVVTSGKITDIKSICLSESEKTNLINNLQLRDKKFVGINRNKLCLFGHTADKQIYSREFDTNEEIFIKNKISILYQKEHTLYNANEIKLVGNNKAKGKKKIIY